MKDINELSIDEIREEYRKRYCDRSGAIVFDGIVNNEKYGNVLFLLKEANQEKVDVKEKRPINESLNENAPWRMWIRASEWVYGLSNTVATGVPPYTRIKALSEVQKHDEIKKIAVININKADGIGSPDKADIEKRLQAAVDDNADLLRREIELAKPRVIVCGNTFWYLQKIYNDTIECCDGYKASVEKDIGSLKNVLIIDYCHPAAHYSSIMAYYGIMCSSSKNVSKRSPKRLAPWST